MSHYQFRLPDIGEGVAEAEIVAWHVKVGDAVEEDQNLADVMTDKATVEITSPVTGVVTAIHGDIGSMAPVGSVLLEFETAGAEADAPVASPEPAGQPAPISAPVAVVEAPVREAPVQAAPLRALPPAAPSTRRRAKQEGIDLRDVASSDKTGRITSYDLEAHIARIGTESAARPEVPGLSYAPRDKVESSRVIGLRRKIAEKMQEAKRRIPHIAYVEEVDVTELEALRQSLNADRRDDRPKLTLLPFLLRALVRAIPEVPHINSLYDDDNGILNTHEAVHVGIATQTPGGLMVPVVRHAEAKDVWQIAGEIARLSKAARDGSAKREELSGSTITVTSLGPLGGIATTPVINHPEVSIIGPNKIVDRPVVDGAFVSVRKIMNLSSSFDHRIVDGYDAAVFVQKLKRLLEHPALIFMD